MNLHAVTHAAKHDAGDASAASTFPWENAIIHIEVTSKAYNYIQPWQRSEKKVYKSGVVVDGHQIITTAEGLADQTLIRLKKQGRRAVPARGAWRGSITRRTWPR